MPNGTSGAKRRAGETPISEDTLQRASAPWGDDEPDYDPKIARRKDQLCRITKIWGKCGNDSCEPQMLFLLVFYMGSWHH